MDRNKKIMIGVVGLGLAGLAYFLFFKKDEQPGGSGEEWKRGGKDGLDNPMTGPYMGDKPRSQGNSETITTLAPNRDGFNTCVPAMESEGGGKGKYISVDDPHTPGQVEQDRRQLIHDSLSVGDTIDLDGRSCKIKKMWADGRGLNSAIQCEDHSNITYDANSSICW